METERSKFQLRAVKQIKGGGLHIRFEVERNDGSMTYYDNEQIESARAPHPDLTNLFEQYAIVPKETYEVKGELKVTGVNYSGQNDNRGVIVTAVKTAKNNLPVVLNSSRVKYAGEHFKFQPDLEAWESEMTDEVYLYLFEGKGAQLSLFDYENG